MTITQTQLEDIITPIIGRLQRIESILETTRAFENDRIEILDSISDLTNPSNNMLIVDASTLSIYIFTNAKGLVQII